MINIDWKDDYDEDTTDPQDGGYPLTIWWEDMRPEEVRDLVKNAYCRGAEKILKDLKELSNVLNCLYKQVPSYNENLASVYIRQEQELGRAQVHDEIDALLGKYNYI